MQRIITFFLLMSALSFMSGCQTIESRIEKNQMAFNKLPDDQKQLVRQGVIKTGMNSDAVYMALGNPSRSLNKNVKGVDYSSWIYESVYTQSIPQWTYVYGRDYCGRVVAYPYYNPIYTYYDVPYLKVTFKQGKVVEWEQL